MTEASQGIDIPTILTPDNIRQAIQSRVTKVVPLLLRDLLQRIQNELQEAMDKPFDQHSKLVVLSRLSIEFVQDNLGERLLNTHEGKVGSGILKKELPGVYKQAIQILRDKGWELTITTSEGDTYSTISLKEIVPQTEES